ncbi:hypothetical protein MRQ47_004470 [Salmonella enterica]|nr:hypothetical protein [Salmonella enterica]
MTKSIYDEQITQVMNDPDRNALELGLAITKMITGKVRPDELTVEEAKECAEVMGATAYMVSEAIQRLGGKPQQRH